VRNRIFFLTWAKYFFFSVAATQSFGPTQPHTQWVLGADPPEVMWQEPEAVHLHLVLLSVCFSCKNIALKTFVQIYACDRSWDSVVGKATGYRLDDGSEFKFW
jgi:hypothetical protein